MKRILQSITLLATIAVFTGCATAHRPASDLSLGSMSRNKSVESQRMLIWRAWLSLEVADVSNAVARVTAIAEESGGYVQSQSDSGEERASLTVRVPSGALTDALSSVESIGIVTSRRVSSQDVTEQYVDTDARLKTMTALRDRLRALLEKAQNVKDILAIEKELGRVQADIDSMQARLKSLKGKVDLASIDVSITKKRVRILGPLGYAFKAAWWTVEKLFVIQE